MRKSFALVAALATASALAVAVPSAAASSDRADIAGSHPSWASPRAKIADSKPSQQVTFRVYLRSKDAAGAEAAAQAVTDPRSPQFRHNLTPQQVLQRFGPQTGSVTAVRDWLRTNGFSVGKLPANQAYVEAKGDVSAAQRAFNVRLSQYRVAGTQLRAADRNVTMPSSLAAQVLSVVGLDQSQALLKPQHTTGDDRQHSNLRSATPSDAPIPPSAGFRNARPCSAYFGEKTDTTDPAYGGKQLPYAPCGYKPGQLRGAYGIDKAVASGKDGRGTTVAIIDAFTSPTLFADANTYVKRNDPGHPLRANQFKVVSYPESQTGPDECDASGWYGEQALDVEAVHAMAPGANITYTGASNCQDASLDKAMNDIVAGRSADIISNSYGDQGEDVDADVVTTFNQIAMHAALEGIGVYFSSGDDGDQAANLGHPEPDFPAISQWVTAVGGTSLGIGADGKRTFETGWETGQSNLTGGAWTPDKPGTYTSGGGGGTSVVTPQPWYQRGTVPTALAKHNQTGRTLGRVVPDISALGDPNTGMLVGQTQTFPEGVSYDEYRIGGTSLACPLMAGMVAVSDQVAGYHHGFINPSLYLFANRVGALSDITAVDKAVARVDYVNQVDNSQGTKVSARQLNHDGLTIHTARGYDDVTGLGVPNGAKFLKLS